MRRYDLLEKVDKGNLFNSSLKNNKRKKGNRWGSSAALLVVIIFGVINYIYGKDNYQILAIFGAYTGFKALGKYIASKKKLDLLFGLAGILILIGSFILEMDKILN